MDKRCLDCHAEVGVGGHVADSVVDKHAVELAAEAHGLHVAFHVLAFGIERAAGRQHPGGAVHEDHLEVGLQVGCVIAPAAPELEQRPNRARRGSPHGVPIERPLLFIISRRRQQRPPLGKFLVHLRHREITCHEQTRWKKTSL
jgi:hypothetical protein